MQTLNRSWIKSGQQVIDNELNGLRLLKESLDETFLQAIQTILNCQGRVIVTGIGKSGHIGKKIAATFASTGTKANFVHPAEASHGDLGMLSTNDVLLAISNSGETRELSDILMFAKRHSLPIIAVTKNLDSTLGNLASIVIVLPNAKEACPIERAPTTSTLLTLALGDALAMTLMETRNFKEADFANFHPGGKLGAAWTTVDQLVKNQMQNSIPLVTKDDDMSDVVLTITNGMLGHAGVVDEDGQLIGIISDGDLRRAYADKGISKTAAEIMSHTPKTTTLSARAFEVRKIMQIENISAVFVVDENNNPVGLLHLQQLLKL